MTSDFTIKAQASMRDALLKLDANPLTKTLLVIEDKIVIGTVTDGDIRRSLLKGLTMDTEVSNFMKKKFTFLTEGEYDKKKLDYIKKNKLSIVPELKKDMSLNRVVNFNEIKTILPLNAVIMAGGMGSRLMPYTKDTPKPLLKIGEKPIIQYNLELLRSYGINNIVVTVKYLAEKIMDYYEDGSSLDLNMTYLIEDKPLGTIGAVKQVDNFLNDYILVMNSDLLTNVNLEQMFNELMVNMADMIMATIDYSVDIPYGIVELKGNQIIDLKEKPTYTYYSNAGIYIFKKEYLNDIPEDAFYNATDLLEQLLKKQKKVLHYPIKNYWRDIGRIEDYNKAQEDIHNVIF